MLGINFVLFACYIVGKVNIIVDVLSRDLMQVVTRYGCKGPTSTPATGHSYSATASALSQRVAHYAALAITPSTWAAYSQGGKRYRQFCQLCQCPPLPASDFMLASFAAHLASVVKLCTVANYLAAIRNLHLGCGMQDSTPRNEGN